MQHAIHVHYGIHLCETILCENRAKFASTKYPHLCRHVAVNVNVMRISRKFY